MYTYTSKYNEEDQGNETFYKIPIIRSIKNIYPDN